MACRLHITLKDGRTLSIARTDFEGTTTSPLSRAAARAEVFQTSAVIPETQRTELLARLNNLEDVRVAELFRF